MKHPLGLTVMMYHYVRDRMDAADAGLGITGFPVSAFETQLDELSRQHTFVTWPEVRAAIQDDTPLPASPCLLTFDDGLLDHYIHVFRILRERGISGLFFILARGPADGLVLGHRLHYLLAKLGVATLREAVRAKLKASDLELFDRAEGQYCLKYPPVSTEARINLLKAVLQRDLSAQVNNVLSALMEEHVGPERDLASRHYLDDDQIREMAAGGMHFGGHSHSHPWFDWIDTQQRTEEIRASAEYLRDIEPGPWAFAYPYGGLSDDSPDLLRAQGFAAAFTTNAQVSHGSAYYIGRLDGEEYVTAGGGHA